MNSIRQYLNNFLKYKPLMWSLVEKDIKIKYRKSIVGFFWSLLNPLLMMAILSIVFINLFKFNVENYPIYILSGQLFTNFFIETTTVGMGAIINNDQLIQKVYTPKYLFVITQGVMSLINLMASFTALFIMMLILRVDLHYTAFLGIVPLMLISVFSLGTALLLSSLAVKFRDLMHLWAVFTTALFYLTPVIYPLSLIRNYKVGILVKLNPITNYLTMFRDCVMYNRIFSSRSLLIGIGESILLLIIGVLVFRKRQDGFILDL